jgi:uncharacterized membrane protein
LTGAAPEGEMATMSIETDRRARRDAEDEKETNRVEAFSDGVFAVAITLLVLELKVPRELPVGVRLFDALCAQWPAYVAFLTSFATIGIMWINHHRLFTLIRRVDHGLLVSNTLLLLTVTLVPFATSVLTDHHTDKVSAMLYSGNSVLIAVLYNLLWRWSQYRGLLHRDFDATAVRTINRAYAFGPVLYLGCFGLAFVHVLASVAGNLALAIFFALPQSERPAG